MLGGNAEEMAEARGRASSPEDHRGGARRGLLRGASSGSSREFKAEGAKVKAARWPLRHRHRTPRVAPHRQPAPRPLRPPGRPGHQPVLPVARGRPDAAVQRVGRRADHDPAEDPRRRADRAQVGHQGGRQRAAPGREPQLRPPQERAQVRRRDERAAQGRLRPASEAARGRPRVRRRDLAQKYVEDAIEELVDEHCPTGVFPEEWDLDGLADRVEAGLRHRVRLRGDSTSRRSTATSSSSAHRRRVRRLRPSRGGSRRRRGRCARSNVA